MSIMQGSFSNCDLIKKIKTIKKSSRSLYWATTQTQFNINTKYLTYLFIQSINALILHFVFFYQNVDVEFIIEFEEWFEVENFIFQFKFKNIITSCEVV